MKTIVEYFHFAGQFTNPSRFVAGAVISGLLSFAAMLVLIILLRRFILVYRASPVMKWIAYSYFIVLPLLAAFFGFKWGFFHSLRQDIKSHAGNYAQQFPAGIEKETTAALQSLLTGSGSGENGMEHLTGSQLIDTVSTVVYNVYGSTLSEQAAKPGVQGQLINFVQNRMMGKGVATFVKKQIRKILKEKLGVAPTISHALLQTQVSEIVSAGFFVKVLLLQTDYFLKGLQQGVLITFLIILSIPLLEIVVANCRRRNEARPIAVGLN
ncbi:hypothetical protein [Chitinophaga nivalis]|uniref:ABC transmembrane type-1 domain-containing protein n=1 Tax=Chitinophaga nivalis TaxID=2991709 RepID=A0ABT3IP56_9BACT|nr:hypothetical protein [Chitinophaga nivalis]MCW3464559.1 hypothetical protein [Chitinophaga nivalis]MCW3485750.1 hypothetical protein [Chitinophaga nivalis]